MDALENTGGPVRRLSIPVMLAFGAGGVGQAARPAQEVPPARPAQEEPVAVAQPSAPQSRPPSTAAWTMAAGDHAPSEAVV